MPEIAGRFQETRELSQEQLAEYLLPTRRYKVSCAYLSLDASTLQEYIPIKGERLPSLAKHQQIDAKAHELRLIDNKKAAIYVNRRKLRDPMFRVLCNLRTRIRTAVLGKGKSKRTRELIGCSMAVLRAHLESRFTDGMSWENYGLWHIDHIRPCASYDLLQPEQQQACFHFTNLQPLWAEENRLKRDRWQAA